MCRYCNENQDLLTKQNQHPELLTGGEKMQPVTLLVHQRDAQQRKEFMEWCCANVSQYGLYL
jgi:hypothetical protein